MLGRSDDVCRRRLLVNVSKNRILFLKELDCYLLLVAVDEFRYLEVKITRDGSGKDEADSKVLQRRKTGGTLTALLNGKNLLVECARGFHEGTLVSALIILVMVLVMIEKNKGIKHG